jgi:MurNAc alpha-1-phosphate uridylyltransferase
MMPATAMVLAAGLGTRMRPITVHTPKPLVAVGGRTMLDRVLDHLEAAGVGRAVVNLHHLPERIRSHLAARPGGPAIVYSDETDALLETGGGIRHALPLLGEAPFLAANADIIWTDGRRPALVRLAEAWDPARMDALLLLTATGRAHGYDGRGDFRLAEDGRVAGRPTAGERAPFLFAGVQILAPEVFAGTPEGAWSLNRVFDRLLAEGRLFGLVHDGAWYHVGTPDSIAPTESLMARCP